MVKKNLGFNVPNAAPGELEALSTKLKPIPRARTPPTVGA